MKDISRHVVLNKVMFDGTSCTFLNLCVGSQVLAAQQGFTVHTKQFQLWTPVTTKHLKVNLNTGNLDPRRRELIFTLQHVTFFLLSLVQTRAGGW